MQVFKIIEYLSYNPQNVLHPPLTSCSALIGSFVVASIHFAQKLDSPSPHPQNPNIIRHNPHHLRRYAVCCHHVIATDIFDIQKLILRRDF